ncbi:Golgi-specific brefeldin A-resistance guanine nucleotide exchange factor 1-like [Pollicipes pollicipes]|uniref:Golgi-specific brefeldin A-resistance guanine nucleotide exchange factor 1-like n=1 Tax=Pollicipes pollicipes TaxID=41117 RepID=UPI0018849C7D|nr:Golgi-specific brefeldin A-resistance guanine nucleotide exchange factor 1-like [Pollicipes pollicipes]
MDVGGLLSPESLVLSFGANTKAQLAARTVFTLTHRHADILRDGWRNLLDCLLQLGHPELLVTESKFLRMDSLHELVKALILASHGPDGPAQGSSFDEDSASFFLEILIKVVIQNRRCATTFYSVVMSASASHHSQLMERGMVGLIRLVIRLVRREELTCQVLQSLRMLLLLRGSCLQQVSRQATAGLHQLLRTAAGSVTAAADWAVLFTLLECVGAGARPPAVVAGEAVPAEAQAVSDTEQVASDGTQDSGNASDKCYSDSELYEPRGQQPGLRPQGAPFHSMSELSGRVASEQTRPAGTGGWILVGREGEIEPLQMRALPVNQFNITHDREVLFHDPVSFAKAADSLAFLIRDAAYITADNFQPCVQCLRTFVEAGLQARLAANRPAPSAGPGRKRRGRRRDEGRPPPAAAAAATTARNYDADESDSEAELPAGYHQIAIQLLDLMHTLHTRAAHIFGWFSEPSRRGQLDSLWEGGWCPLLQGIARLCCDPRRQVRASAVTYLQRSLLVHDLQALAPTEWEACFHKVLFPLLAKLLEPSPAAGLEETRMRAATLLCKVFLQHLTPLLSLPTFTALWLTILDFMDKYLHADRADLLHEAIPESMKNMLLVMETAGIFHTSEGFTQLWAITWDRIDTFLPTLREEVFRNHPPNEIKTTASGADLRSPGAEPQPTVAPSMREVRPASPLHHEELVPPPCLW